MIACQASAVQLDDATDAWCCEDGTVCAVCFTEFDAENAPASEEDMEGHGVVFSCDHAQMFHLQCLLLEARQDRPFQCPLCRAKFGFSASCICGMTLEVHRVSDPCLYGGTGVLCDHCAQNIPGSQSVYHCPRGSCEEHPSGYDICYTCAGHKTTLRRSQRRRRGASRRHSRGSRASSSEGASENSSRRRSRRSRASSVEDATGTTERSHLTNSTAQLRMTGRISGRLIATTESPVTGSGQFRLLNFDIHSQSRRRRELIDIPRRR